MSSRWSGIFIGALVVLSVESMLLLLGAGMGLVVFPFERMGETWSWVGFGIGSALYAAITLTASYFAGGFIASRLHSAHQKGEVYFQGLGVWGVTSVFTLMLGMMVAANAYRGVEKGVGAMAALELIHKTRPRIVTDLSLLKGKAVTNLDMGVSPAQLMKAAKEAAETPEALQAAETARKATAASCLAAFLGMLTGMFAGLAGAWYGRPTPATAVPAVRRVRDAA